MRISDWSSDVCSSDLCRNLLPLRQRGSGARGGIGEPAAPGVPQILLVPALLVEARQSRRADEDPAGEALFAPGHEARSEERRVGKACVSTFRSRWAPYN